METRFEKIKTLEVSFGRKMAELKKDPKFQEKTREFSEEITKGVKALWVKKLLKTREWNTFYKDSPGYTFLEYIKGEGVVAGFVVGNFGVIPAGCQKLNEAEMVVVDEQRRMINCLPTVFEKSKVATSQDNTKEKYYEKD